MRFQHPSLVQPYRLARLTGWARLWLDWVARVLAVFVGGLPQEFERNVRARLGACADIIAHVIFLRAFARLQRRRIGHIQHAPTVRRRRTNLRIALGASLRRALRGNSAAAKLAALARVVQHLDAHIAKLVRRLACGLTRRRSFAYASAFTADALAAACADLTCPDTS